MSVTDVAETTKPAAETDKYRYLHTMIRMRDLDKSLKFYTDLLGMRTSCVSATTRPASSPSPLSATAKRPIIPCWN